MPRGKKFTAEQIIGKLREAEVGLAQGKTVPEPSTWVMGLAGIACVAWRSVRRRRAR
jgi:hypothetical protein